MAGTLYLVTNTLNGKQYVGQTIVAGNRVGHGKLITKSYNKYGKDSFTYEPVCTGIDNRNTLNFMEKFWIKVMDCRIPNGYNIEHGDSSKGKTSEYTKQLLRQINLGFKHTEEAKRKISEASRIMWSKDKEKLSELRRGRIVTEEVRAKISASNTGKKRSEETCKRIGLAKLGFKHSEETKAKKRGVKASDETKAKLSASLKGRVVTAETRAKISVAQKGRVIPDEVKMKIKEARKHQVFSDETKQKLSDAAKRQWARQRGEI
jgi:group I intron endonuclease